MACEGRGNLVSWGCLCVGRGEKEWREEEVENYAEDRRWWTEEKTYTHGEGAAKVIENDPRTGVAFVIHLRSGLCYSTWD